MGGGGARRQPGEGARVELEPGLPPALAAEQIAEARQEDAVEEGAEAAAPGPVRPDGLQDPQDCVLLGVHAVGLL